MGFLDKLLGRAKGVRREGGSGGGREGARVTEPARTSAEGTMPTEPKPEAEKPEGSGPDRGPS
jgi:hypothetical protein